MSISNISSTVNQSDDSVTVTCNVDPDLLGQSVTSVALEYGNSSGNYSASVNAVNSNGGDVYTATIPSQALGSDVYFIVQAELNQGGATATQDSPEQVVNINDGGTQDASPTISTPSDSGVTITWNSSDPGMGIITYNVDGQSTQMQDSESASSTSHSITLSDLLPSTKYDFTYTTDFDDTALAPAVSASFNFTTAADTPSGPPQRTSVSVSPVSIPVGGNSSITVQVQTKTGQPQSNISVNFSLGAGQATGSLSVNNAQTDATGKASTVFYGNGLGNKTRRARRAIVAEVGTSPKVKRRRAIVLVTA